MAAPELLVRRGNVLSPVTEIWFRNSASLLSRVSNAYLVQGTRPNAVLTPLFEGIKAPATLTASAFDATSVTLKWAAVVGAVKYQIMKRTGEFAQGSDTPTLQKEIVPASGTAWTGRTWKVTGGIATATYYIYSVRAVDAAGQIGPETNPAIKYFPGQSEIRVKGSVANKTFQASGSDSWDSELVWTRHPGQPGEGFASGTAQSRNRWGCIDYSGIYAAMVTAHGEAVADNKRITDAYIKDIARTADGYAKDQTMHFHPGTFAIGVAQKPVLYTGSTTDSLNVEAPDPGKAKGAKTDIPNAWATQWAKKSHAVNGLIIYRSDGKGPVRMHAYNNDSFPSNWDLVLSYDWDYQTRPKKSASAVSYTFER